MRTLLKALFGFVFPAWTVYALVGTLILGAVGAVYGKGRIDQWHKDEITALKIELDQEREANRLLAEYIARLERAAKEDAEEKAKDDAEITDLKTKLTDLVGAISDPDRECFSADDIDGLLGVWGKSKGGPGHGQSRADPGRHPGLLR